MNTLDNLAARIAQLHSAIGLRPTLERAAEIGELLSQAKAELPHGRWLPWLRDYVPFLSARSCQIYIEVFKADGKLANAKLIHAVFNGAVVDGKPAGVYVSPVDHRRGNRHHRRRWSFAIRGRLDFERVVSIAGHCSGD